MSVGDALLNLCLMVTPPHLRAVREEQWRADLRDGPSMGISAGSLLAAAARSSATARVQDMLYRGGTVLARIKGGNMKMTLGIAGAAAFVVAGTVFGVQASNSAGEAPAAQTPVHDLQIQGYEGWWNSTPVDGDTTGLPAETVTVNTRTGDVIDVFNRAKNSTLASDVDYTPVPDPSWPANSIIIIDTASGQIIEDFLVDDKGSPLDENGKPLGSPGA
ncbi:hypothetical protein [Arthrobacter sp. Leaf137]|uniref:hypothetical protein n=1 Tax=Arthrobacter sp. Leaf137 TaxID=1736271 RepID=UPI0006F21161|nr:hypothetical protein [Arthrobacter sp. Leaf137]KQQ89724.1 hypothetical protein ASF64_17210 [Arthrobacter sp. Leaf137]